MRVLAMSTAGRTFPSHVTSNIVCDMRGVGEESEVIAEKCLDFSTHFLMPFYRFWASPLMQFETYRQQWESETAFLSSPTEIAMHPSYQKIIGMGPAALSFILTELNKKPDHWFWALKAITGEDPVLPEHKGRISLMVRDWLDWGVEKGIKF